MRIPHRFKTVLALILALAMLLALVPASTVLAAGETEGATETPGTTATEETPAVKDPVKTTTPSTGTTTPSTGTETPSTGTETPSTGTETPSTGTETPSTGTETPSTGTETPSTGTETPSTGTETPSTGTETPTTGTETPTTGTPKTETPKTETPTTQPEPDIESDDVTLTDDETETPETTETTEPVEGTEQQEQPVQPKTVSLSGTITWSGFASAADRPNVRITLKQNGAVMAGKESVSTKGDSYSFPGLPKFDLAGKAYTYGIKISSIAGCTVTPSGNNITVTLKPVQTQPTETTPTTPVAGAEQGAPAAEGAIDADAQDVIEAITALPDTIDPSDLTAANRLEAVASALAALGERYVQVPEALRTKLANLRAMLTPNDGISIAAVQTDVVKVSVIWASDVPTTIVRSNYTANVQLDDYDSAGTGRTRTDTIGSGDGWKTSFSGVNALMPHTLSLTSITPNVPAGCTVRVSGESGNNVSINIEKAPTTALDIKAKVVWSGVTTPPKTSVDLTLGTETVAAASSANWACTFTTKLEAGNSYDLTPEAVDGYTSAVKFSKSATQALYTVTYTKIPASFTYKGNLWFDTDPTTRNTVYVDLYRKYPQAGKIGTATCPDGDNYFEFVGVPQYLDGQLCIYSVKASDVKDTTKTANYTKKINTGRSGGAEVCYYREGVTNQINLVVSVSWRDNNNARGKRPIETTVNLYRNGRYADSRQVKYADDWSTVFEHQDYKENDKVIKYTVTADNWPYYTVNSATFSGGRAGLTYYYGAAPKTSTGTTTSKIAPKVGDPAVYLADTLTPAQVALFKNEDTRAAEAAREISIVARANSAADIDFTALQKTNKDVAGWLVAEGTEIDYPIVKGSNNSYYLNRLYNKEQNRSGALFIDSGNNRYFSDRNTVIYGHHMGNGSMFASLLNYKNQSYYDAHPKMQLYTPKGNYEIELFAALTTGDEYASVSKRKFSGTADFGSYLNSCINKSDFKSTVDVSPEDKIVTFVTCSFDYDDTRYLVMGRLASLN